MHRRHALSIPLPLLVLALALIAHAAPSIASAEVRTDARDVDIIISGEIGLHGIFQDNFWRAGAGDDDFYVSGYLRLTLDIILSHTARAFVAIHTPRRFQGDGFGSGILRAPGAVLGRDDVTLELDELFIQVERLFIDELDLRVGQQHLDFRLDTGLDTLWWEGHGASWLDTAKGRAPATFASGGDFDPVGLRAAFHNFGTESFEIAAGGFWLAKDLDIVNSDVLLLGVWGQLLLTEEFIVHGGYFYNAIQFAEDYQNVWVAVMLILERGLKVYGDGNFQFGDSIDSAYSAMVGVTFVFSDGQLFLDISWFIGSGDDPTTADHENFQNGSGLQDLLIIESDDFGAGRHDDITVWKAVVGFRFDYQLMLFFVGGIAESHATSRAPGIEVDLSLRYRPVDGLELSVNGAYIFESKLFGTGSDTDGILIFIKVAMRF